MTSKCIPLQHNNSKIGTSKVKDTQFYHCNVVASMNARPKLSMKNANLNSTTFAQHHTLKIHVTGSASYHIQY